MWKWSWMEDEELESESESSVHEDSSSDDCSSDNSSSNAVSDDQIPEITHSVIFKCVGVLKEHRYQETLAAASKNLEIEGLCLYDFLRNHTIQLMPMQ